MKQFYRLILLVGFSVLSSQASFSSSPDDLAGREAKKPLRVSKSYEQGLNVHGQVKPKGGPDCSHSSYTESIINSPKVGSCAQSISDGQSFEDTAMIQKLFEQVMALPRDFDLTTADKENIHQTLNVAWKKPDCRMSKFRVGATIIIDGKPYYGVNNEDPSFNVCCGERSAMWGAQAYAGITGKETKVTISYVFAINPNTNEVAVDISSSCGLCRQAYVVHGDPDVIFTYGNKLIRMRATDLLPHPYLFLPQTQVIEKPKREPLLVVGDIMALQRKKVDVISPEVQEVFLAAVTAARLAYAPYDPTRVGVGLLVKSQLFEQGSKIFKKGIRQNPSYGCTINPGPCTFHDAAEELSELEETSTQTVKTSFPVFAIFALNNAQELVWGVAPSGADRQAAADVDGGMQTQFYFIDRKGKLVCQTLSDLLPHPFTFNPNVHVRY